TPELLKETFNIKPSQVTDIKALMGDSSDNIPGVKGVGQKTAYSLIWEYETLDNIYEKLDILQASDKVKEKLRNDKEMAYLSKTLATIDINVKIEFDYKKCMISDINESKLYELFTKLEFSKFLTKYDFSKVNKTIDTITDTNNNVINVKEKILIDKYNIDKYLIKIKELFSQTKLSYLLNLAPDSNFSSILGLDKNILALYDANEDNIYILDLLSISSKDVIIQKEILNLLANSNSLKIGYNIKQDIRFLLSNLCDTISNFKFDIMIAYYLMDASRANYTIEYIIKDIYGIDINVLKDSPMQISLFDNLNEESEKDFLSQNDLLNISIYLKGIYFAHDEIIDKLKKLEMLNLFNNIEMPLAETLASMEHNGMYIDVSKLEEFNQEISSTLTRLEKEIYNIAGEEFNINSTQQLSNLLFEKLKLPTKRKIKSGYSTDKAVLDELESLHPIIGKIIEYRQIIKLKTTFVDGLKANIGNDGRVHTTFMQTVASTGRISSTEPNLQNIPSRLELGSKIRKFFVGENSCVIVDGDYSQIELRVLSHISHDENMINAFLNNIDIHKVTASQVFGVNLEDVTHEMRTKAKAVNFGIVYGISEYGLAKSISSTRKEAAIYIQNYLETYHGIRKFMKNIVIDAKDKGYVTTLLGRRRYIPEINNKNKNIEQFGQRVALNTPIQGSAADIIKLAMNKIYKELKNKKLKSKLIMQVHDELLIETFPDEIEVVKNIMYSAMEHIIVLDVPLNIDLNVGKSWYDAK
ncbi:MAG: DNA polymerase I, partial [Clostridia bacterium]